MEKVRNFFKDESGATMVEYALMLGLIATICIVIVTSLGLKVQDVFTRTDAALPTAS
jgi:pilus assembly protein Flp/PilA